MRRSITRRALRRVARPPATVEGILRHAVDRLGLTARGLARLLRLARTLADLAGRNEIASGDVTEALLFRATETAGPGEDLP